MSLSVDLNADLGEGAGHDDELLALVSSANIACGLHAGSAGMMRVSLLAAREQGVAVGAHPGFDDRESFGRRELTISDEEVFALVVYQVGAFVAMAHSLGMDARHVKPHGALYNMAARSEALADAVARAVRAVDPKLILFAPGASALSRAAQSNELRVAREVFADRNYRPDGSLVPRGHPEALLHDPEAAANRVFGMLQDNKVRAIDGTEITVHADTICLHGDTPGAVEFARQLRLALHQTGILVAPAGSEDVGAGAPSRRRQSALHAPHAARGRAGSNAFGAGDSLAKKTHKHLAHVASFCHNPIVFFTACTHRRRKILADPACHEILRGIWQRSAEHDGWWVGHYILMPDHVHFFAQPEVESRPMASWVEMWKSVSSRRIIAALKIAPPIWQAEYFDRYLRSGESYSEKWNYVEQNAVRAGLVERIEDWPYRGVIHELRF